MFAVSPNRKYKHFSIGTNGEPKTALQQGGLARESSERKTVPLSLYRALMAAARAH